MPQQMINIDPNAPQPPQDNVPVLPSIPLNPQIQMNPPMTSKRTNMTPLVNPPTANKRITPVMNPPIATAGAVRPRSMEERYKNIKGVNVHIHNIKNVSCQRPFKVT